MYAKTVSIHNIKIMYNIKNMEDSKKRKGSNMTRENDKTFLKDGMSTADIRKTVQYIREYIGKPGVATLDEKTKKLQEEHAFFFERYPLLFDMSLKPDFSYDHLNYFLRMRDQIANDKVSSEDASVQVGKDWFEKFVDVSKLPQK